MLTQKISEKEIGFMESWYTPYCLAEALFPDFDNFGRFEENKKLMGIVDREEGY